jgi:hypothetical protein
MYRAERAPAKWLIAVAPMAQWSPFAGQCQHAGMKMSTKAVGCQRPPLYSSADDKSSPSSSE